MLCPNCGKEIEENDGFCKYCGKKFLSETDGLQNEIMPVNSNKKRKSRATAVIAVIVLFIFLIGVSAIVYVNKDKIFNSEASDNKITSDAKSNSETKANESTAKQTAYKWVLEPKINAENIDVIVADRVGAGNQNSAHVNDDLAYIKQNSMFGLIDYSGKIIADVKYAQIFNGYGGKYCLDILNETTQEYQSYTLNENKQVVPCEDSAAITGTDVDKVVFWESKGNKPVLWNYGASEATDYMTDTMAVQKITIIEPETLNLLENEKYALMNQGKLVTGFIYEGSGTFHNGLIAMKKDGKWGYLNAKGETVFGFEYESCWNRAPYYDWGTTDSAYAASGGFVTLYKNNQCSLYKTNGERVIDFGVFEVIRPVYEGKAWVKQNGMWGVISVS